MIKKADRLRILPLLLMLSVHSSYSQLGGPMSLVSSYDNRYEIFVETAKGILHYWMAKPDDYGTWSQYGTPYLPAPDMSKDVSSPDPHFWGYRPTIVSAVDGTGKLVTAWIVGGRVYFVAAPAAGSSLNEPGQLIYGTENINSLAIAKNQDGRIELFTLDKDGFLSSYSQVQKGVWAWSGQQVWTSAKNTGFSFSQFSVTPFYDGRLLVAGVLNTKKNIIVLAQPAPNLTPQGNAQTKDLGGTDITAVVAAQSTDHRLELFAFGGNAFVYHCYEATAGRFDITPWAALGTTAVRGPIQVLTDKTGRMEVISANSQTTQIQQIYQTIPNGGWNAIWQPMPFSYAVTGSAPIITASKPNGDVAVAVYSFIDIHTSNILLTVQLVSTPNNPPSWTVNAMVTQIKE